MIEQRILSYSGNHADEQRQRDGDNFGSYHQQQRIGQAVGNDLHGRLSRDDGGAKIAAQDAAARAGRFRFAIAVAVNHHPIVADQPVKVLGKRWLV